MDVKTHGGDDHQNVHHDRQVGLDGLPRERGDHGGEELQPVDARGLADAEEAEEREERLHAVVLQEERHVLGEVHLRVSGAGERYAEEEDQRGLVGLLLPAALVQDDAQQVHEHGANGALRVQHLRVRRRGEKHQAVELEDVGHVLDDAAVQKLGVMGGGRDYVLHVRREEGFDVVAESRVDAGDADEGDERLEEVMDVEGVGDVAGEESEVL